MTEGIRKRRHAAKPLATNSKWLTVQQAAGHAQVAPKMIYREVAAGRLKAARVGGRRSLRFLVEWINEWLEASATPVMVRPVNRNVGNT